ncbi:MAG: DUF3048 domain-containing protein [Actinomycetia bacterium]|nr:DUF3048 domain-containing protein [Actinomycetes bacterium]
MSSRTNRLIVAVSILGSLTLVATACGGGTGDADSNAATAGAVTTEQVTTAPPTTIEVATTIETTTTEVAETTVSIEPLPAVGPVAPLTGAPSQSGTDLDHPALAVKIDNHVQARPQVGLDQADLVFDLRAEGVTRFMAVFHSQIPETVGPVRSSRTSDFDLLRGLDNPIYASSGGNAHVMGGVASLPIHSLTNHTRGEYYRWASRPAPHNLFVDPGDLLALVSSDRAPTPWFSYRQEGQPLPSSAIEAPDGVRVDFTNTPTVDFAWSEEGAGWLRSQDGSPHLSVDGEQLAPENVVIMITTYGVSAADANSPEVRSTGSGPALVLTDGHVIAATWHRSSATDKPLVIDEEGSELLLTPGRTWVLYPEAGQVSGGGLAL